MMRSLCGYRIPLAFAVLPIERYVYIWEEIFLQCMMKDFYIDQTIKNLDKIFQLQVLCYFDKRKNITLYIM